MADDAPGLVDGTLCLAAHQNHPREAGDLVLCPRSFPHQFQHSFCRIFYQFPGKGWGETTTNRKATSASAQGPLRASGCWMKKPWLTLPGVLVAPFLLEDAPGWGWHHSHPRLQERASPTGAALPSPVPPQPPAVLVCEVEVGVCPCLQHSSFRANALHHQPRVTGIPVTLQPHPSLWEPGTFPRAQLCS